MTELESYRMAFAFNCFQCGMKHSAVTYTTISIFCNCRYKRLTGYRHLIKQLVYNWNMSLLKEQVL